MSGERKTGSTTLQQKISNLPSAASNQSILRVHDQLRRGSEKAYEPQILGIGPYHHGKPNLQMMEQHKLQYLKLLLETENADNNLLEEYIEAICSMEVEARTSYIEPVEPKDQRGFAEMMILDGCFIIMLFRKLANEPRLRGWHDQFMEIKWIMNAIQRDLLLFENQIPLCVLYKLSKLMFRVENSSIAFVRLAFSSLGQDLLGFAKGWYDFVGDDRVLNAISSNGEIKHLLGLIHHGLFLSNVIRDCHTVNNQNSKPASGPNNDVEHGMHYEKCKRFRSCAKELQEAGIRFEKAKGSRIRDIDFQSKTLKLPALQVGDRSESFFRNFITYEQYGSPVLVTNSMKSNPNYANIASPLDYCNLSCNIISDYIAFLNCLIHTARDVAILREFEVLENLLIDDALVSNMINKLRCSLIVDFSKGKYSRIFGNMNAHCLEGRNMHITNLNRKYFNAPWAKISFVAACFMLGHSVFQSVMAFLSYYVHDS